MAAPIGSVVELTYFMSFANQTYMNVLHYRTTQASASPTLVQETERILDAVDTEIEFGILGPLVAALAPNVTVTFISAQFIQPTRSLKLKRPIDITGSWATNALTGNVGATITKVTALSGRRYTGSMHVPALPPDAHAAGEINALYLTVLNDLKNALLDVIVDPVDGGQYDPCLLHRPSDLSPTPTPTPLFGGIVQPQARVMRRRTVGVGI